MNNLTGGRFGHCEKKSYEHVPNSEWWLI